MLDGLCERRLRALLSPAVEVGGGRPRDITVHDRRFYRRALLRGLLGMGEAYMDGWWDCAALDEMYAALIGTPALELAGLAPDVLLLRAREALLNQQSPARAFMVAQAHYDLGNELFEAMLDSRMAYSCGYWKDAASLEAAQEAKLELVCRKLRLSPGMRVLDIGCGWGAFAEHAARRHGARVVGITVSKEQVEPARRRCAGLPVEIRLQDYRELDERFDRVASIAMFEAVGPKNYADFMGVAHRCLADGGLFLLHTIGREDARCFAVFPWLTKRIFPNGTLPLPQEIRGAACGLFDELDWHAFGRYYDPTLLAWFANFDAAWPRLRRRYDERFYRMWKHYLMLCAGAFRAGLVDVWQVVLGKSWSRPYEPAR